MFSNFGRYLAENAALIQKVVPYLPALSSRPKLPFFTTMGQRYQAPGVYGLFASVPLIGKPSDHKVSDYEWHYRILLDPREEQQARTIMKHGLPSTENLKFGQYLALSFDRATRVSHWVGEKLVPKKDGQEIQGNRQKSSFSEDKDELSQFRARNQDYAGSGYDRGHLVPAANVKFLPQEVMDETFNLANIAPQVSKGFNVDYWARFESFVRGLSGKFPEVYVITGPLFAPAKGLDQNWYVNYKVIGNPPNVAVPTHFWKVVLIPLNEKKEGSLKYSGKYGLGVFILPNKPIDASANIQDYLQPIEALEKMSGLRFFDLIDRQKSQLAPLCGITDCTLPSPNWWVENKEKLNKAKSNYDKHKAANPTK